MGAILTGLRIPEGRRYYSGSQYSASKILCIAAAPSRQKDSLWWTHEWPERGCNILAAGAMLSVPFSFQRIKSVSEHMANAPEEVLVIRAKSLAKKLERAWDERLEGILRFCTRDPAQWFPSRGKKKIVSWMDIDERYLEQYVGRYYREREGFVVLQPVATKKDPAVDEVLKAFENVPPEDLERIGKAHRLSMQAENIIGELLERYVARMLETKGWIWCCGETMKSVDFIKGADKEAKLLQIKNRSNSENSSSSAIRRGTTIEKWYRTSSTTGKTRWELLPENSDADDSERRTEEGFYQFVIEEAKRRPSIEEIPMEADDREPQLTATR